jgi:putative transposase
MIDRANPLPITQQCHILELSRSTVYYQPLPLAESELELMRRIDEIHLKIPYYGSRRIRDQLQREVYNVNSNKVQRLMGFEGHLRPVPETSDEAAGQRPDQALARPTPDEVYVGGATLLEAA